MHSSLALPPDRRSGFVVLSNGDGSTMRAMLGEAPTRPAEPALDVMHSAALIERERVQVAAAGHGATDTSARVSVTAAASRDRQGVWRDLWFGEVVLRPQRGARCLQARKSPLLRGQVSCGSARAGCWTGTIPAPMPSRGWTSPTRPMARWLRLAHVHSDADFG